MEAAPLVSTVIIFFQAERFLDEAIRSVVAQTYSNWELVLVDDGSTDGGPEIAAGWLAADPRIRVVTHSGRENRGMSASRNLGVAHAEGELLAFLDADDVWLPEKLQEQVELVVARPEVGMVYGRTLWWYGWTGDPADVARDHVHDPGVPLDVVIPPGTLLAGLISDGSVPPYTCSVLIRREVFDRLGGFEDAFTGLFEDQVFFAKVFLHEAVYVASACWDRYRQHDASACAVAYATGQAHPVDVSPARGVFLEWVAAYLTRAAPQNAALRAQLAEALRSYRFPTAPWEVTAVGRAPSAETAAALQGFHVDFPAEGERTGGQSIEVVGWALGRAVRIVAVELVWGEHVVGRAAVGVRRPDLGAGFPQVPDAERAGFRTSVSAVGTGDLELVLQAVLDDGRPIRLATIRARRLWRRRDLEVGAALVSVVLRGQEDARALGEAIECVLAQTYPRFELVVVLPEDAGNELRAVVGQCPGARIVTPPRAEEPGARAAGLAAGLAVSRGSYVLFLEAEDRLQPTALETGLAELAAHPERMWTTESEGIDGGEPGPAVFRRLALGSDAAEASERRAAGRSEGEPVRGRRGAGPPSDGELSALVLLYHRVAELTFDPWGLAVSPRRFAEQLSTLASRCTPLSLAGFVETLSDGEVPERTVVLTFDDGYEDNGSVARELLERAGLAATMFVPTGCLESRREFWWDELGRILLWPGSLPADLELRLNGSTRSWPLGEQAEYEEDAAASHSAWRAWEPPPTSRHALYRELYDALARLPDLARADALARVREWAGVDEGVRPEHRTLDQEQVRELGRSEHIEIGAHTVSHPRLSLLPPDEQEAEIVQSKERLEAILGAPVASFAYPHGTAADYGPETVAAVERAGFTCACVAHGDRVPKGGSVFELPRVQVLDWSGPELAAQLDAWFAA